MMNIEQGILNKEFRTGNLEQGMLKKEVVQTATAILEAENKFTLAFSAASIGA